MEVAIRAIGNSKGVVLPKPLLAQAGLDQVSHADIAVQDGCIVLRKPRSAARAGWAPAAQQLAEQGQDALLMGDFANLDDGQWVW